MDKWKLIHNYNTLTLLGKVRPVVCADCGVRLVVIIGPEDDPVLWCVTDDSEYVPGTQFWADVRAVVAEHFMEV